jgi:hypothetical protein
LENKQDWAKKRLSSLEWVILQRPLFFYLSQHERNFDPVRSEVQGLLERLSDGAARRARDTITQAETALMEADDAVQRELEKTESAVSESRHAKNKAKYQYALSSERLLGETKSRYENTSTTVRSDLLDAKKKVFSGDYAAFLEAQSMAEKSRVVIVEARRNTLSEAEKTGGEAYRERESYQAMYERKVERAWHVFTECLFRGDTNALTIGIAGWIWTGFGGCIIRASQDASSHPTEPVYYSYVEEGIWGGIIVFVIALVWAISRARKELE